MNAGKQRDFHSTYYVVAHFYYIASLAYVFLIFSAVYALFLWKRAAQQIYLAGHLILMTVGTLLVFLPQFFLGLVGMPRRYIDYQAASAGWDFLSQLGSWIYDAGLVFMLAAMFTSKAKAA